MRNNKEEYDAMNDQQQAQRRVWLKRERRRRLAYYSDLRDRLNRKGISITGIRREGILQEMDFHARAVCNVMLDLEYLKGGK